MKTPPSQQTPSGGSDHRLVRVPWSAEEDESITLDYAYANGAFNSYRSQAAGLNRKFHDGKPVRSASAVRRREGKLLSGSANAGADLPPPATPDYKESHPGG